MLHDILTAIPLGILLAFTIGPVFFVLLETSITKGFRAAMVFDLGVICGDLIFILIAYFSTNQLLEKLNSLEFYQKEPPKALGFEWVQKEIYRSLLE